MFLPPVNPILTGLAGTAQTQKPNPVVPAGQALTARPTTPSEKKERQRPRDKRDRDAPADTGDEQRGRTHNFTV